MKETALITGASGGIGEHLARIHAASGGHLVLVARSEPKLRALAEELRQQYEVQVRIIAADLARPQGVEAVFNEVNQAGTSIDYLINNAGFGDYGAFAETQWEKEGQMIDLNVRALTHLTKLFLPQMKARGTGRILNVASTASFQPGPFMAVYFATKHYVLAFSDAIAEELKGSGVTVTTLCPGPTTSGFQAAAGMQDAAMVKGKKLPTAEQVAQYGYRQMMQGKRVVIHGWVNRIMAISAKMLPTPLGSAITKRITQK